MIEFSFAISSNDKILDNFIIDSYTLESDNLKLYITLKDRTHLQEFLEVALRKVIKTVSITILENNSIASIIDFNTPNQKVVTITQDKTSSKINAVLSLNGKLAYVLNK